MSPFLRLTSTSSKHLAHNICLYSRRGVESQTRPLSGTRLDVRPGCDIYGASFGEGYLRQWETHEMPADFLA